MLLAVSLLVSVGLQAPKYYKSPVEVFCRRTGWTAGGGLDAECHPHARRNHIFTQTPEERDAFLNSRTDVELRMLIGFAVDRIRVLTTQIQNDEANDTLVFFERYERRDKEVEILAAMHKVMDDRRKELDNKRKEKRVLEDRIANLGSDILAATCSRSPLIGRMIARKRRLQNRLAELKEGRRVVMAPGGSPKSTGE